MEIKNSLSSVSVCFIIFCLINNTLVVVQGLLPLSKTFKFVNHGKLIPNGMKTENGAQFLPIPRFTNYPFQLCFYTTTTKTNKALFTLGLSMGGGLNTRTNQEGLRRWVWAANPNNPVTENSTLTFSPDGNLILADTNGRAVWETHTANKGVTDIKLLCNGNLVLLDSNGKFVWQSFRYPTDTLLNGQGLVARGSNRLVSGSYSLDVGQYIFPTLLFKNKNNPPMEYHSLFFPGDGYQIVRFLAVGNQFGLAYAAGDHGNTPAGKDMWAQVAYNTTLSMLRLEKDGKLFVYTYNGYTKTWERVFSYFLSITGECKLPQKCGVFGLCKNQKCISCPSSKGIMAASWNKECIREKIPDCKNATSKADYYKIPSVYSSIGSYSNYQDYKKLTVNECKNKCSKDCRCTAFLYQKDRGTCLVATTEIYTLSSDPFRNGLGNLVHPDDAYIKYAK